MVQAVTVVRQPAALACWEVRGSASGRSGADSMA
jgi:hypothetical protein